MEMKNINSAKFLHTQVRTCPTEESKQHNVANSSSYILLRSAIIAERSPEEIRTSQVRQGWHLPDLYS